MLLDSNKKLSRNDMRGHLLLPCTNTPNLLGLTAIHTATIHSKVKAVVHSEFIKLRSDSIGSAYQLENNNKKDETTSP